MDFAYKQPFCSLYHSFSTENSLWGPFLSVVNDEQARQTDRRYWQVSSDGTSLTQGEKQIHAFYTKFGVTMHMSVKM